MVFAPPLAPVVYAVNILCRVLTCKEPYNYPEIVYDNGDNDLISLQYLNKFGNLGHEKYRNYQDFQNQDNNFFDVGAAPDQNVVKTKSGRVEGYYMTTSGGRKIGAFEGIKYGNANRWEV